MFDGVTISSLVNSQPSNLALEIFPFLPHKESQSQPELILLFTIETQIQLGPCAITIISFHSLILRTIWHRSFGYTAA
jgi:hypothetical protein